MFIVWANLFHYMVTLYAIPYATRLPGIGPLHSAIIIIWNCYLLVPGLIINALRTEPFGIQREKGGFSVLSEGQL